MFFDDVLVVILSVLAGAWTLPTGITFGLDPSGVFVAATVVLFAAATVFWAAVL